MAEKNNAQAAVDSLGTTGVQDAGVAGKKVLLEMRDLHVGFPSRNGILPAVDGVSLKMFEGEIVGIVGESGSGKSVMSQSILRLLEHDSPVEYKGEIIFDGKNLLDLSMKELRDIRGNDIAVIFQNPLTSLSPVHTIAKQLSEVLVLHKGMKKSQARGRAEELLELTGIPSPGVVMKKYPFELSGGMQQRVMIAMALACEPKLLIADEPTTALDVTIQEQILNLILELNEKVGMSVLFITHDMGVVNQLCDKVKVMYLGQVVEEAYTEELFAHPVHPYTQGLLSCIPSLESDPNKDLPMIKGTVPPLTAVPKGCHFSTRCPYVGDECESGDPQKVKIGEQHFVKCWKYQDFLKA